MLNWLLSIEKFAIFMHFFHKNRTVLQMSSLCAILFSTLEGEGERTVKIGIIGPQVSLQRLRPFMTLEDAFVELVEYPCSLNRVPELLEKIQTELDGIIFTGARYLNYANQQATAVIPWREIKRSQSELYRLLLRAKLAGRDICRITYDLPTSTEQMERILCGELGLEREDVALFRYNDTPAYAKYMRDPALAGHYAAGACAYHRANLRAGRADVCLTDSSSVAAVMRENGWPVYYMDYNRQVFLDAVNEIRIRIQLYGQRRTAEHREAVLALTVRMKEEYGRGDAEYRQLRSIGEVESRVFQFAQAISGALERRPGGQYMIFASADDLEANTDGLRDLNFIKGAMSVQDVEQVALGIGYGLTHMEARTHALQANQSARQQTYSCWYVKDGGEVARGPFILRPPEETREYDQQRLERIARDTNVGITVLEALTKAQRQYGFREITPGELAKMTGMSLNNIHRILVRLESHGYAAVVGQQSHAGTGRPRRLFRLNLGFVPQGADNLQ